MTCELAAIPVNLKLLSEEIIVTEVDGAYVITGTTGGPIAEEAMVILANVPATSGGFTVSWIIEELPQIVSFGVNFDGTSGVLGAGIVNLYYRSDGRLIENGVETVAVPELKAGDILDLYVSFAEHLAFYVLNGQQIN